MARMMAGSAACNEEARPPSFDRAPGFKFGLVKCRYLSMTIFFVSTNEPATSL